MNAEAPMSTAGGLMPVEPATMLPSTMSPAMQIMLDDRLFERAKQIALYLSRAEGFVPGHLIGKQEACFAVVTRALVWKLDPFAVAQSTYSPGPGKVGYEGKLCHAILENSGRLEGGVTFEHYGEWSKIQAKFTKKTSEKGREYAVPNWKDADEIGLGVTVRAKVRGEAEPREFRFDLVQAFPRNSTLWATDPKTQICYTAVRRFASVVTPALMMGVPFDREDFEPQPMRDITGEVQLEGEVRPTRSGVKDKLAKDRERQEEADNAAAAEQQRKEAADREGQFRQTMQGETGNGNAAGEVEEKKTGEAAATQQGNAAAVPQSGEQPGATQAAQPKPEADQQGLTSADYLQIKKEIEGLLIKAGTTEAIDTIVADYASELDTMRIDQPQMAKALSTAFSAKRIGVKK